MQTIKSELLELLRRNDLLRSSLLLGRIQDAGFREDIHLEKIMELAARVWHLSTKNRQDPILKAQNINYILFEDYGIVGKSEKYKQIIDDPTRYYLHMVMEKKIASPLSLAVLYAIMADQVGLNYEILALPAHYLLKITDLEEEFYIDPFEGGKFLNQEEFQKKFRHSMQRNRLISANLFEKVTVTQLAARLIQQLKHIYILKGKGAEALRAVELLTAIYPESPELTRDRGILYCEMEYFSKAIEDLRYYLQERPKAEDVGEIRKLTSMLKGYREIIN